MNIIVTRHRNRHRPAPVREGLVLQFKNTKNCAPLQSEMTCIRFARMHPKHLNDIFVCKIVTLVMSNGRATIQFPIDHHIS